MNYVVTKVTIYVYSEINIILYKMQTCPACDGCYVFALRYVGTSRSHKEVPLLCCLDCRTLTCYGDYKEDDAQLISDVEYNSRPHIVENKQFEFLALLNMLSNYCDIRNYNVGEIGCNLGIFIKACSEFGVKNAIGYDINPHAIAKGKEIYGEINLKNACFGSDDIVFDLVVAIDVFEHLRNVRDVMTEVIKNLNPGGYFYVTVPRFDKCLWHWLKTPSTEMMEFNITSPFRDNDVHIIHFSIEGLQRLGTSLGLQLVKDFVDPTDINKNWPLNGVLFRKDFCDIV